MRVSLIATVLNEGENIRRLLDSIVAQTRLPDEVVICDGGSQDNTLDIIKEYSGRLPLHILQEPNSNISRGRNMAIAAATGEIIAATDAGVRLEPDWLEKLLEPWKKAPDLPLVAGFFRSDPQNTFELAMGATVLPEARDIRPATFNPSSRSVAFKRSAWQAVGGYPEWLGYGEDVLFDMAVRAKLGKFGFAPDAISNFRPRGSVASYFRQYFNYASGDGHAGLIPHKHLVRYLVYLIGIPLGGFLLLKLGWWMLIPILLFPFLYVRGPIRRLTGRWHKLSWQEKLYALALLPYLRLVGDVAKMIGYPYGWWLRLTRGKG